MVKCKGDSNVTGVQQEAVAWDSLAGSAQRLTAQLAPEQAPAGVREPAMHVYDGCPTERTPHLQRPEADACLGYVTRSKEVTVAEESKERKS